MSRQILLMDKARINRALKRIAIQVWESLGDQDIVIVGLNERGYATAKLLFEYLTKLVKPENMELYKYDVKNLAHNKMMPNCSEKNVLIVDDVIFSGKTMFDALTAICSVGDPAKVEVATLIDRGHRRYPIQADLIGLRVPTKFGEHIEAMIKADIPDQVILFKN